jgi:CRP-like cAMP-binding protein
MGRANARLDAQVNMVAAAGTRRAAATAFSSFPPAAAQALREASTLRVWNDGDVLLLRDRVASSVMAIVHGRARILAVPTAGQEVFVRWQLAGETVGLASAVSGLALPVDVVATGHCETLRVGRDALLAILRSDAEYALAAAALLAGHAYDLINLLALRTEQTLTARVLGVLRHLALLNGRPLGGGARELPLSQNDLASAVGSSRSRVNAELQALERAGVIELGYRQVIVRNLDRSAREGA